MTDVGYNRIVLVGNGLDLAMGYPTSYEDFLVATFKVKLMESLDKDVREELYTINRFRHGNPVDFQIQVGQITSIAEVQELCNRNKTLTIHSNLLRESINSLKVQNWVDIELLYFELLTEHIGKLMHGAPRNKNFGKAKGLNHEMDLMTNLLRSYLRSLIKEEAPKVDQSDEGWRTFQRELEGSFNLTSQYFAHGPLIESGDEKPERICYVNFNYTPYLINRFGPNADTKNHNFLHIHGALSDDSNPVIFGYGDDSHELYQQLENENNDEILRLFKAFHYPKTYNYHTLLDLMDAKDFDVLIVGHSCGLSDRTLLKTVFEKEKCRAIKVYHQGDREEHFRKTIAISRHFDDKASFRKKVLPFDPLATIPQTKI